jgi:hypothetical protein
VISGQSMPPKRITGAGGGVNGTAVFDAIAKTVTFTPASGFSGAASFDYTISDGHGGSATATVEGDISFPNFLDDGIVASRPSPTSTVTEKLDFVSTVRGRAGYAFDHWLFYATGGFPLTYPKNLELLQIVSPVFLGYLGAATHFIFSLFVDSSG